MKIPVSYHVRLHSMKILTGKPISEVVTEALDAYFRHVEQHATSSAIIPEVPADDPVAPVAPPGSVSLPRPAVLRAGPESPRLVPPR